jgi:MYXO-CTERM domain-containing protein
MLRFPVCLCALGFALASVPTTADACGGTFCDGGATPVAQTGETILFVMGEGSTEAHIQIAYDPATDADKFAWVVPLLAVPEFSVGSQPLFANLLAGTVPAYGFSTQPDECGAVDDGGNAPDGGNAGDEGVKFDAGSEETGGPDVVLQQTVGAFEITVLSGGTAMEVMEWLGTNGYTQDPAAEPILAEYLEEGYLFAAFKLTPGAQTNEIHPVVLRFDTEEACVPLRLTRIAAQEDMEVRAFFLADARVVPQNYQHVLVNPLMLDWPSSASNYKEVITLAVDAFEAEGKAFVTEFAGPSARVSVGGVFDPTWSSAAFADVGALEVVSTLASQGLMSCSGRGPGAFCSETHPLLRGLLMQFLPPPDGVTVEEFWGCLACYEADIDVAGWDPALFVDALEQRIVAPGAHAVEVLSEYPYLTRMYTTISPAEMTEDPFFWANPDLEDVDLTSQIATQRILCNDDRVWTLPDGREVYVPSGEGWPTFEDQMPYEEEVSRVPPAGAPMVLADRREAIATLLATHNCDHDWPTYPLCGPPTADDTGGDSSGDGAGSDGPGANDPESRSDSGCGCTSGDGAPAWLVALVVLGVLRARRRSSSLDPEQSEK